MRKAVSILVLSVALSASMSAGPDYSRVPNSGIPWGQIGRTFQKIADGVWDIYASWQGRAQGFANDRSGNNSQ